MREVIVTIYFIYKNNSDATYQEHDSNVTEPGSRTLRLRCTPLIIKVNLICIINGHQV